MRPALVISANNLRDCTVAFISSAVPAELEETDFLLTEEDDGFIQTRLKKDSVFKMNKIATLDRNIILGRLGAVSEGLQKKLDGKLRVALGV